jgi:hypothetical protein
MAIAEDSNMAYYPDLSRYEYLLQDEILNAGGYPELGMPFVNVGWLASAREYPRGETDVAFQERLALFCLPHSVWTLCMGSHTCEFCAEARGSYEIWVVGREKLYAAPVLIHHYVIAHGYRPPDEFIEALMECPVPESREFKKRLERAWHRGKRKPALPQRDG